VAAAGLCLIPALVEKHNPRGGVWSASWGTGMSLRAASAAMLHSVKVARETVAPLFIAAVGRVGAILIGTGILAPRL